MFEACKSLVESRGQHLLRGRVGVLGGGGVLKPTLDCNADEREGKSVNTMGRGGIPATIMFLPWEGTEGDVRGWLECWVLQGCRSCLHILGRGLFWRYGDGFLVRWQQNLKKDEH